MLHISQRKALYRQLATLFSYPDPDLLALLQDPEALSTTAGRLGQELPEQLATSVLVDLEAAYTALFDAGLGGAVAPPYGSVYLDPEGQLMGPSTFQVANCYAEAGLRLEGTVEPADFLPTELEYLYFLVDREVQALASKDMAKARGWTRRQLQFLEQWLLPWLPKFVERLEKRPLHPLYPWAGELLLSFCRSEVEWLNKQPAS